MEISQWAEAGKAPVHVGRLGVGVGFGMVLHNAYMCLKGVRINKQ